MKLIKGIGIALSPVVLCLLVTPKTMANEQSSKTVVTFTVPVEVPGVSAQALPAGTYLFKTLESSPDRDIIQISSPDGSHVFTTFLGVPNSRLKAPDLITVMFSDRPAADPQALKAWYCPGRTWGDQAVYEKPRAAQLAKETNEPVLSTSVVLAISSVEVLKTAVIEAVSPTGETVAMAQIVDAPPVVAPALIPPMETAIATTPNPTEGSAVAVASSPAKVPDVATESAVAAGPAVALAPTAAIEPLATTSLPATTDPAAASASAPEGGTTVAPAQIDTTQASTAVPPVAPVIPVAPIEPSVRAQPAVAPAPEMATATLPKTASTLPLIGLIGLLMVGAGFILTGLTKQRA